MRNKPQSIRQSGNTLIMVLCFLGFAALIVAFVVFNYNQLTGLHKQSQNSIDAASLAAAKDMAAIVVDGPMGRMALAEDPSGDSKWPVYGVNTVMATLRIDAIIARELNNKTLAYLVQNDLNQTNQALAVLTQRIKSSAAGGTSGFDRNGKTVNIKQDALDAYISNNKNLSLSTKAPENFTVTVGTLSSTSGNARTTIPVPNPESLDQVTFTSANSYTKGTQKYYLANQDIAVAGMPVSGNGASTVRFAAVGTEPTLLDQSLYSDLTGSDVPVAVKVSCDQSVKAIANPKGEVAENAVHTISCAQAGNRTVLQQPGVFEMAFPAGIPTNPVSVTGGTVDFSSAKTIMNSSTSQIVNGQLSNVKSGWTDSGKWYQVKGGPNPGGGTIEPAAFKGIAGLDAGDPSLALNCCVYDWLRSCTYLPNMQKVLDALDSKFATAMAVNSLNPSPLASHLFAPTYAVVQPTPAVTTAILTILPETLKVPIGSTGDKIRATLGTLSDPRNLSKYNENVSQYDRQQANMWGYVPADAVLPAGAAVVSLGADGKLGTVDGNPYHHLLGFLNSLDDTNSSAVVVNQAVMSILKDVQTKQIQTQVTALNAQITQTKDPAKKLALKAEIADLQDSKNDAVALGKAAVEYLQKPEASRVLAALINSTYVLEITNAMINNLKSLSGTGVKKISPKHYIIGGADFYPAQFPWPFGNNIYVEGHGYQNFGATAPIAAKNYILNKNNIKFPIQLSPPNTPTNDWCTPPIIANGVVTSALHIYKHNSDPVITLHQSNQVEHFLPPALAQSAAPALSAFFHYQLSGGSSKEPGKYEAKVVLEKNSPFTNVPTGKGQTIYQSTSGLVSDATSDGTKAAVTYQIQAKDQFANAYPSTDAESSPNPSAAADFFGSLTPTGAPVAAIWAISCPTVPPPPPQDPPEDIPIFTPLDVGKGYTNYYCLTYLSGTTWWGLAWYPWGITNIVPGDGTLKTPLGLWPIRRFGAILKIPPTPPVAAT